MTLSGTVTTPVTFTNPKRLVRKLRINGGQRDGNLYGTTAGNMAVPITALSFLELTTAGVFTTLASNSTPHYNGGAYMVQGSDGNFYGK